MLIGIGGSKRVGKTTAALFLAERYGLRHDSFAAPIRQFACSLLGLTLDELEDVKEFRHPVLGGRTPRELMQRLGTDWVRDQFNPTAWVDAVFARNPGHADLVLSDVRFPNEAEAIKSRGGIVVRINRHGCGNDSHVSEQPLPASLVDYEVNNSGTFEHLYSQLEMLMMQRAA